MQQLFPEPQADIDPMAVYASDDRPPHAERPWLMINMISSVDGGVAIDGVSGGLGGPADQRVFGAIRAIPDVIMVAAGTVIAENYRRPQTPEPIRRARVGRGQAAFPRLAIVTNSLSIDPGHRVFDRDAPPIVITRTSAPSDRRDAIAHVADIVDAGPDAVDLEAALVALGGLGARVVLAEGGPTLNGGLVAAGLVDEVCLSMSPKLVGGIGPRIVTGGDGVELDLRLERILEEDGLTFHRYIRT